MEVDKERRWEDTHTLSTNLLVGLFVHHAYPPLPNIEVGTPNSFVSYSLFCRCHTSYKAFCPKDHYPQLLLQFYMQLFELLKIFFSNPYSQLSLILYFSPFFLQNNLIKNGWGGEKKQTTNKDPNQNQEVQVFVTLFFFFYISIYFIDNS